MSDSDDAEEAERCGAETTSGEPCQNPAESCPWHNVENPPDNGRDSKLTKQRQEEIATMIENGHSMTAAARANGVTKQTVMNWIGKGQEQDEGIYADFFDRYTRAKGIGEMNYLELIADMAEEQGDHRFLASLMKQRYPESWQDTDTGVDAEQVEIVLNGDKQRYEPSARE